jgi:hypothetical protein
VTDAMTAAIIASASAIVGGVVGGLLNGAYQHLRDYLARPKLFIDFEGTTTNQETAEYKDGDKIVSEIYIRATIRNTGCQVAKSCRVFLAALTEVHASGITPTSLRDAKQLAWAGHDFSSLDVPPGIPCSDQGGFAEVLLTKLDC